MACPIVSGVAALGLSYAKELGKTFTREEFTSLLLSSDKKKRELAIACQFLSFYWCSEIMRR